MFTFADCTREKIKLTCWFLDSTNSRPTIYMYANRLNTDTPVSPRTKVHLLILLPLSAASEAHNPMIRRSEMVKQCLARSVSRFLMAVQIINISMISIVFQYSANLVNK